MGTSWSVRLAPALDDAAQAILQRDLEAALDDIIAQMSHWEPDSLLSRINRAPTGWYQVPPAFFEVISCAMQIARLTHGAFDPTLGELVQLWGFGPRVAPHTNHTGEPPDARQIVAAKHRAGWQKLHLNPEHRGVWQPGGLALDFSSIAKGYGVDVMAQTLGQHGIQHYMVELGGEVRTRGQRDATTDWQLWVEAPELAAELPTDAAGLPITLRDQSIATSGDYRRYFLHQGQRHAHTLNPRTGWTLQNDLASVSVIHPQCMVADALSTALLCMGLTEGLAFARQQRIAALFMVRGDSARPDDVAVEWTDDFYRLACPRLSPPLMS